MITAISKKTDSHNAIAKDPSGIIEACIENVVFDKNVNLIDDCVLILKDVSVFHPSPNKNYLTITQQNICKIYPSTSNAENLSPSTKESYNPLDVYHSIPLNKKKASKKSIKKKKNLLNLIQLQMKDLTNENPAKSEKKPVNKSERKPNIKAEIKPIIKSERKPNIKEERKPIIKEERKPNIKAEIKPIKEEKRKMLSSSNNSPKKLKIEGDYLKKNLFQDEKDFLFENSNSLSSPSRDTQELFRFNDENKKI